MIKFNRNVVFFDLETTGIDTQKDRIVEICIIKMNHDFNNSIEKTTLVNPTIPIPAPASEIHGITDDKVKDQPTFKQLAKGILDFIDGCDIIGYNSNNFDAPLLYTEFVRAGVAWDYSKVNIIDVCNIYKIKQPRTLEAAVNFYCGREHEGAHGALADVQATIDVFKEQVERYDMEDMSPEQMTLFSNYGKPIVDISGKFTVDAEGDIIFNFGMHMGKKAKSEPGYLQWMIKGNFSPDTKSFAQKLLWKQQ